VSYSEWRRVVGINLDAAFHVAKESFSLMKEQSPQVRVTASLYDGLSLYRYPVRLRDLTSIFF